MTERGRAALRRTDDHLAIGPSALAWDGTTLTIDIAEIAAPLPRRLRGTVRLHAGALGTIGFALDAAGRHHWQPLAAHARIEVALQRPALRWSGTAYFDHNRGDEALESGFAHWQWSRSTLPDRTLIAYDAVRRDGSALALALACTPGGDVVAMPVQPAIALPPTRWRLPRTLRGETAKLAATLEDAPFYGRSLLHTRLGGQAALTVHETLSLDRFRAPWVQALLPLRMPRRGGGG